MKRIYQTTALIGFAFPLLANSAQITGSEFNPAISLILDGRYTDIDNSELEIPGFILGGEAGLPSQGFSTGHNELAISANIDDKFYGLMTAAIVYEDGDTVLELEEAFIETLSLGNGVTVKGGRFFSGFGYLNSIHDHAHDFADRPLIYDAMVGGHLVDTGVQLNWVAPTDLYLAFGAEITTGSEFPGGENEDNNNGSTLFVKTGGDIGTSSSWQLGFSRYSTEFDVREAGGHAHGGGHGHGEEEEEAEEIDNELHEGEVEIAAIDFVYKWAPNGNIKNQNLKVQFEYFQRDESGEAEFSEGEDASAEAQYDGEHTGYYIQTVYQFMPAWRVGVRYDHLEADNKISDFEGEGVDPDEFLEESGLGVEGSDPERWSYMVDYSPSHFSRIRLQFNQFDNGHDDTNESIVLQYNMSLGSHGAHKF